ncbi:hypothetical protein [Cupriavidus sp. Agwp_2]|uniref:hypothetical protein n=1 Tax=Cupriavidus sp. Agwp_2 TaxID=2897324 RepID=UPI003460D7A0
MSEQDKMAVKVTLETAERLVVEAGGGKELCYYRNPIRTMELTVDALAVTRSYRLPSTFLDQELGEPSPMATAVTGVAALEGSRSIAVIGDPDTRASHLRIRFTAPSDADRAMAEQAAQREGKAPRYTGVVLGYLRGSWEVGERAHWYIEARLPREALRELAVEVRAGHLQSLQLGLQLRDIYTDDEWAPPAVSTNWYLRPNRADNTLQFPESAHGDISQFIMQFVPTRTEPAAAIADPLVAPDNAHEESPDDARTASGPARAGGRGETVPAGLAEAVLRLTSAVRWVGGAIALLLLLGLLT